MSTALLRLAFVGVLGSVAGPASAQHAGPCPYTGGPPTGITITESTSLDYGPSECLFGPDGKVRAALYPPSLYTPYSPRSRVPWRRLRKLPE